MKWHPWMNAVAATAYITAVVTFLRYLETYRHDTPDTMIDGIGALSLATFSAAVMAFLFFFKPLTLFSAGESTRALSYFLKTLAFFGVFTLVALALVVAQ